MPPDADNLRQRRNAPGVLSATGKLASDPNDETIERIATLKGLRGNEVCIDGVIYDISSFDHPGGETIKIFGGNDCTVQYKMIHP